jgi:hypothetical protein
VRLEVPCANGCGGTLEVDEQTLANAVALGITLIVKHDTCPTTTPPVVETPTTRRYRTQLIFVEVFPDDGDGADLVFPPPHYMNDPARIAEVIAAIGKTVDARNFAEAVNGPLTTWLNETWPTLQENAALADLPGA